MRATRYQTGNSADIPRDMLRKMIFSLDNANLPMLTWGLPDGSVLQVQKTEYENVVRYWGKKVEICYVLKYYNANGGGNKYRFLDSHLNKLGECKEAEIPTTHFLRSTSSYECKVGSHVYLRNSKPFFNTVTGKIEDYTLPANYQGSAVLSEGDSLYVAYNNVILKITYSGGEFKEEYITCDCDISTYIYMQEGFFYSIKQNTGSGGSYQTIVSYNKNTGAIISETTGHWNAGPGWNSLKSWDGIGTYHTQDDTNDGVTQIINTSITTPYGTKSAKVTIVSGMTYSVYDGKQIAILLYVSQLGTVLYREAEFRWVNSQSSQGTQTDNYYIASGEKFYTADMPYGTTPQVRDIYGELKGFTNNLLHVMIWNLSIGQPSYNFVSDNYKWKSEITPGADFYDLFGLKLVPFVSEGSVGPSSEDYITYLLYLPGLEKDPTIAALLK